MNMQIHIDAREGNIEGVKDQLAQGVPVDSRLDTLTPLMCAVESPKAGIDMVRLLIENGADLNAIGGQYDGDDTVLGKTVAAGDVEKIRTLLDAGADIHYLRSGGYDVLIDAMHGQSVTNNENLVSVVKLLIERGAELNQESDYGESALRIASRLGWFEVVRVLLEAGADASLLQWTDLMHAIALGSLQDVEWLLAQGADLIARDSWERTPWLLSLKKGDLAKAQLLLSAGADRKDCGRCGKTPMMHAIENGHAHILEWLIQEGFDIEARNEFGETALIVAVESGDADCVKLLLDSGANVRATASMSPEKMEEVLSEVMGEDDMKALSIDASEIDAEKMITKATTIEVVRLLVTAGEDLSDINDEMRAQLTGVSCEGDLVTTQEDYLAGRNRRFGVANPELMDIPFWKAMVRSGVTAYTARAVFNDTEYSEEAYESSEPVWCYHRFGKSLTELPDGRFIEIGGEHEDFYDPDFCIYNEVVVHHGGGQFDIYGYPEEVFPPTDFHSATLVGEYIYIIGCLGYQEQRKSGQTPVYGLNVETYAIEKVETSGENPGWIDSHKARLQNGNEIHITGGKVSVKTATEDEYWDNEDEFILNLDTLKWRRVTD
jgi:ankyrin repeat protein